MKILVIDESFDVRKMLLTNLAATNCQVVVIESRSDIVKHLDSDLFIINAQQPPQDLPLHETISLINKKFPSFPLTELPIIILIDDTTDSEISLFATQIITLEKPFKIRTLMLAIISIALRLIEFKLLNSDSYKSHAKNLLNPILLQSPFNQRNN
jgi:DNA-binding response OmpR family regulator